MIRPKNHKKHRLRHAWLCALASLFFPAATQAQDSYTLTPNLQTGSLAVTAKLQNIQNHEKICLPAFGQRHGERLAIENATKNNALIARLDAAGCTTLDAQNAFSIQYTLHISPLDDRHFWIASQLSPTFQNGWMTFPGESIFIERDADTARTTATQTKICLKTETPTATTLPQTPRAPSCRTATDKFGLMRSYWSFGRAADTFYISPNAAASVVTDGSLPIPISTLKRELAQILGFYAKLIPWRAPQNTAVFVFYAPFDADYHHGFARHGGMILQLGKSAAAQPYTRRILAAHEGFHLYNGESLKYSPQNYYGTAWMREGVTQYVAFQALQNMRLITREHQEQWMAQSIGRTRDYGKSGDAFDYFHGFFAAMIIDYQWQAYRTPFSMLGFWQWLAQSPFWNTPLDNDAIQNALSQYSAFDFSLFFKKYISGRDDMPIDAFLRQKGLCILPSAALIQNIGLEYTFDPAKASFTASRVQTDSPAAQAGIRRGDTIIPAPDTSWTDASDKRLLRISPSGAESQLRIPPTPASKTGFVLAPCP